MPVPTQPAPNDDGIDLSAGLVNTKPAAPPPSDDGIDLSAGLTHNAPASGDGIDLSSGLTHNDPSLLSQFWAARPHPIEEAKGFVKGMGDTAAGLLDLYAKAPGGVVPGIAPGTSAGATHLANMIRQHTQVSNYSQEQGQIAETVAELMALPSAEGEAIASKIPTLSEHLGEGARMAKFLENNPKVAAMLRIGLDTAKGAARPAAEQGGQTFVKTGGDVPASVGAATVGALTGGALGGGAATVRETGQAVAKKLGSAIARRAASEAAPQTFAASATNTLQRALDRMGGDIEATPVADYGQASKQLEQHANALYDEADRVTDGRWRNANADVQAAKKTGDRDAIAAAQSKLDALSTGFDDANYGQSVKEATDRARSAFNDKFALQDVHNGLVKAFDFGTPETAASRGSANTFSGTALEKQLTDLERDPDVGRDRMTALMGEDGLNSLYDLAETAKNPVKNQRLKDVVREIVSRGHQTGKEASWASGMLGMFLPAGWGKAASAGYAAGAGIGASKAIAENLMNYIATKPRLVKMANYAAKGNVSTRYAATLMAAAINHETERDQAAAPTTEGAQP